MKLRTLLVIFLLFVAAGCASLIGAHDREVPLSKLQQALQKKFPFNNRYLDLFDITVSNPKLSLQPDTNRIITAFDARVAPAFLKQAWQGKLVLSGALKIDATRNALVLTEPRLENLTLDAATGSNTAKLAKLGAQLAEDLLNNTVIYTFKPEDFSIAGMRFTPTKITTRANALVVSFEPVK